MKKSEKIKQQSKFCFELMKRLDSDINNSEIWCGALEKHDVKRNDIIRLRRELMTLSRLLDPYGGE